MTERSSTALEQDAEQVRAEIAETAEQLRDKMSPGQLMDEVVDYFKDGDANKLLANFKHQVRDNPLALALVGGGLAWLMMGSGAAASQPLPYPRNGPASPTPTPPTSVAGTGGASRAASSSPGVADRLGEGVSDAKHAVSDAAERVGDAASAAGETLTRGMHDLRDYAGDTAARIEHAGADAAEHARTTFLHAIEREPLVIGALGVAVGAAIGAMLPATKAEKEHFGSIGAKAREGAEAVLSEGIDTAKHVAGDVYSAACDEADRQGLVPGDKPVAAKVADVAKAAGEELRSATEASARRAEKKADEVTDRLSPARDRTT